MLYLFIRESILEDRFDRVVLEHFAARKIGKLDREHVADHDAACLFDELCARKRRSAGRQKYTRLLNFKERTTRVVRFLTFMPL